MSRVVGCHPLVLAALCTNRIQWRRRTGCTVRRRCRVQFCGRDGACHHALSRTASSAARFTSSGSPTHALSWGWILRLPSSFPRLAGVSFHTLPSCSSILSPAFFHFGHCSHTPNPAPPSSLRPSPEADIVRPPACVGHWQYPLDGRHHAHEMLVPAGTGSPNAFIAVECAQPGVSLFVLGGPHSYPCPRGIILFPPPVVLLPHCCGGPSGGGCRFRFGGTSEGAPQR